MTCYDSVLIAYMRTGEIEQFKTLDKNLIKKSNVSKTLLHRAALYDRVDITRYLINMGLDVDAVDADLNTPLMIAVEKRSEGVAQVLLESNANIDVNNAEGNSVLQIVFDTEYFSTKIIQCTLQRLRRDCINVVEFVEKLIEVGSSMYHASFFKDIQVMKMLLIRGVDINSRGHCNQTALHAAVEMDDVDLAKWILDNGIDVNVIDGFGRTALFDAATCGKSSIVRLLLEHGADPNTRHSYTEFTVLFAVFAFGTNGSNQDNFNECAEYLLQYGAIPENSKDEQTTLIDYALLNHCHNDRLEYLIGQLAILDKLGKLNGKSMMVCNLEEHQTKLSQLELIYDACKWLLGSVVFGKLSLIDLLTKSDDKMKTYVRNKRFVAKINDVYVILDKMYPYYSRMLRKRITKAIDIVKLEDAAVVAFPKLFNSNYSLCYIFSRQVVSYLEDVDLQQLCQV